MKDKNAKIKTCDTQKFRKRTYIKYLYQERKKSKENTSFHFKISEKTKKKIPNLKNIKANAIGFCSYIYLEMRHYRKDTNDFQDLRNERQVAVVTQMHQE